MPDADRVLSDEYFLDDEPDHLLPLEDVQGLSRIAEPLQEIVDAVRDLEERFVVDLLGFQGALFRLQSFLPLSEFLDTGAQFVQL